MACTARSPKRAKTKWHRRACNQAPTTVNKYHSPHACQARRVRQPSIQQCSDGDGTLLRVHDWVHYSVPTLPCAEPSQRMYRSLPSTVTVPSTVMQRAVTLLDAPCHAGKHANSLPLHGGSASMRATNSYGTRIRRHNATCNPRCSAHTFCAFRACVLQL